jgi:hypothetical protein
MSVSSAGGRAAHLGSAVPPERDYDPSVATVECDLFQIGALAVYLLLGDPRTRSAPARHAMEAQRPQLSLPILRDIRYRR